MCGGTKKMKYSAIDICECRNGLGWGVTLYTQGCHFHCKGCFNSETWDFNGGKEYTEEKTLPAILKMIKPKYIKHFAIQGGEPLELRNLLDLAELIVNIRIVKPDIKIWLYTGYEYEWLEFESITSTSEYRYLLQMILNNIDVLVDGQFQEDKKDLTYPFAGSTNQRVIDMNETRKQGKVVLLDI